MTNLTSEQYRDVLKHIPDCTTEIPTVQQLLRKAVQTFYNRFKAYPDMAGVAPGKVGIFGDQTQLSNGKALSMATPMATIVVGRKVPGDRYCVVTSADVGKPHKVNFSFSENRPLGPGCPPWLDYVKGVMDNFPEPFPAFDAAIESSIPMGVGLGSSSALEVAMYTFLEVLSGRKSDPIYKALALQKCEREFLRREVGLVDRLTSILARDRHLMEINCETNEINWIPFHDPRVVFVVVDSHLKDDIFGDEYPQKTKYLSKACELLDVPDLKNCEEDDLDELQNRINDQIDEMERENEMREEEETEIGENIEIGEKIHTKVWTKEEYDMVLKTARFFILEMRRISEALEALEEGNFEAFGEKMNESHKSLVEDFELGNPLLNLLVENSLEVEGVLGSRMTGMGLGLGGGIITLMYKESVETYCKLIATVFEENEEQLSEEIRTIRQEEKERRHEVLKKFRFRDENASMGVSEKIGMLHELIETGDKSQSLKYSFESSNKPCVHPIMPEELVSSLNTTPLCEGISTCREKKLPCVREAAIVNKPCGTWAHNPLWVKKDAASRKSVVREFDLEEEMEVVGEQEDSLPEPSVVSEVSEVQLQDPSFYIVSPFPGARMMFVTKQDLLRSIYAQPIPQPKELANEAVEAFEATYGGKVETIAVAPASATLFGEFMEFHMGCVISLAFPLYTVTVGGKNDSAQMTFKTMTNEVEEPNDVTCTLPCQRHLKRETRSWARYILGLVGLFRTTLQGLNAIIHTSAPIGIGLKSCASFQTSIYSFLETVANDCTDDLIEKVDLCGRAELEAFPSPVKLASMCSAVKFLPSFGCKEGHLLVVNCKKSKCSHYFFDNPSYIFLVACCKNNDPKVTAEVLENHLNESKMALSILNRNSTLDAELKHLECMRKSGAPEEVIKRTRYVITEHERCLSAVKAIKEEDYGRVGVLMNESHASLRDDYEISSPQIENLIQLALSAKGVLGAKMISKGLMATIIILINIADVDNCIRYMRKNYKDRTDKPIFYVGKPTRGAFTLCPTTLSQIP